MQSRPTEVSQVSLPSSTASDQSQTAQHGLEDLRGSLFHANHGEEHASSGRRSSPSSDGSGWSRSTSTSASASGGDRRLREDSRNSATYPKDRIAEYERATSSKSRKNKRHRGLEFRVVPGVDSTRNSASMFAAFPNEVLTHILSHLPPASLSAVSLVSRRFHQLVTTPHAWRVAFSRNFPGAESVAQDLTSVSSHDDPEDRLSEKRVFTRLTPLASWRSEYILRTQLLRSLNRGKPAELQKLNRASGTSNGSGRGSAHTTYNSNFFTPMTHMHATFGSSLNKKAACFIHGAADSGVACTSDPDNARVDPWGLRDPTGFSQFTDTFPGEAEYGLGAGDIVGVPNVMDVSQPYGMLYAEGFPGGLLYYRSTQEQRGTVLNHPPLLVNHTEGVPEVNTSHETITCVWIAKSPAIPTLGEGLIGIMSGSSCGIVSAYSLGHDDLHNVRIRRGTIEARWVLSPGVPIVAIAVDEDYSEKRHTQGRIWAVVLNALGEVFVLSEFPLNRPLNDSGHSLIDDLLTQKKAWEQARTVKWELVEPTRRVANLDPFSTRESESCSFLRSSCEKENLSGKELAAQTKEIEAALQQKPKHFQKAFEGWIMRRRLEVDFGADDGKGAGESILDFSCGLDEGQSSNIRRLSRHKLQRSQSPNEDSILPDSISKEASMFGETQDSGGNAPFWSFDKLTRARRGSASLKEREEQTTFAEEWRTSQLSFGGLKGTRIMTTALDQSTIARWTISEDPLLTLGASSTTSITSSPLGSPISTVPTRTSPSDIPGQRARFVAAGTATGAILLWNVRAPASTNHDLVNTLTPLRIIHTDSPQISCLALTGLHLVHGGSDGLVQAWDVLASQPQPIRTLNSRFATRARRRLIQAEASPAGVGINHFAAGAIVLDPDPTVLRGMVSLGTHLRYWSYSSSAADQYKGNKRRLRRSERGSNQGPERFSSSGRGALKDYISNERVELEREKESRRRERERLAGRFGVGLLGPGASEEEMLAYARLLSEEAALSDEMKRASSEDLMDATTKSPAPPRLETRFSEPTLDESRAIEEALKLSLLEQSSPSSPEPSPSAAGPSACSKASTADSDLDLALRLAQEDESLERNFAVWSRSSSSDETIGKGTRTWNAKADEEFPALGSAGSSPEGGRGKGKGRRA